MHILGRRCEYRNASGGDMHACIATKWDTEWNNYDKKVTI